MSKDIYIDKKEEYLPDIPTTKNKLSAIYIYI